MKRYLSLLWLLFLSISCAQKPGDVFSISPEKPKIGETVTVTYNAEAPNAQLKNVGEITLDVYIASGNVNTDPLKQYPMKKEGKSWTASFTLDEGKAKLLLFRFVSGDSVDDNKDNVWDALVYGSDGKPVQGAYIERSGLYRYGITSFKRTRDENALKADLLAERQIYPNSWEAASGLWDLKLRKSKSDAAKAEVKDELDRFFQMDKANDSLLARYVTWYERAGDSSKAKEIRTEGIARNPKGKLAQTVLWNDMWKETDNTKRVSKAEKYLSDFPDLDKTEYQNKLSSLEYLALQASNFDAANRALSKMTNPGAWNYIQIAQKMTEKGVRLDEAAKLAKKGVEMSGVLEPKFRPYYKTEKDYKESTDYDKGMGADAYAQVLEKLGKLDESAGYFADAYKFTKGEDVDLNARYLECLVKGKKYDKTLEVGRECLKSGKSNDKVLLSMKAAFAFQEGSKGGYAALAADKQKKFDDLVLDAKKELVASIREKVVKSKIDKPSHDFTLKDLSGTPVTLAALKGKVIVIDFWATWCGPCKASFPYLQKVYEKYQHNDNVRFLVIDTWERQKDYAATVANAKKFVEDNKYTYPVLIDGDSKVVEAYGVEGIPTKFILGKDGNIAFESIGFNGPEMDEELTQEIDLLLSGT